MQRLLDRFKGTMYTLGSSTLSLSHQMINALRVHTPLAIVDAHMHAILLYLRFDAMLLGATNLLFGMLPGTTNLLFGMLLRFTGHFFGIASHLVIKR
jgi:hypothetical protein